MVYFYTSILFKESKKQILFFLRMWHIKNKLHSIFLYIKEQKKKIMDIKQKVELLTSSMQKDAHSKKYWNEFCNNYEKNGLSYLQKLLCIEKQQCSLLESLQEINAGGDLTNLLNSILDHAIALTNSERGALVLDNINIARNFEKENISGEMRISHKVAQKVIKTGQAILTDNAQEDQRFSPYTSVNEHRLVSIMCAPLRIKDKVVGAIYIDNRLVIANFEHYELALLSTFAEQAALAIENASLHIQTAMRAYQAEEINVALRGHVKSQTAQLELSKKTPNKQEARNYWKICAQSKEMRNIFSIIEKVKNSELPVLICGESGTGKELIAQALHYMGERKQFSFVSENCAAIPESIFESELFGHEKGAFTGANTTKKGLFEEANEGTLFLDEIGELPLLLQKKLLRTLAEKKIRRLGGKTSFSINTRIITATNCNLRKMIKDGEFREDLFYRLNVIEIDLPSLRDRKEDIPILVDYFINEYATFSNERPRRLDPRLISTLMKHDWPGNIRQLRNEIYRLITLCDGILVPECLSENLIMQKSTKQEGISNLPQLLREVEKNEIEKAMNICENNKSKASQVLGISRFTLQRKLEKYQM